MVIDTTLFNDEFDMLDIHLAITKNYVDRWIILEASRTFSGIPKPYNLTNHLSHYQERYGNRIEVVTLELAEDQTNLVCETMMRQGLQTALGKYSTEDIVIHGDLDEIINPEKWNQIIDLMNEQDQPVTCGFEMYFYLFDQQAERGWKGSVVARRRMFDTPHELYKGKNVKRKDRSHCVGLKEPVGWHWTWIGSDELVKNKARSCIESQHRDPEQILAAFKQRDTKSAINHKANTNTVQTNYPAAVQKVLKQYPQYWNHPPV
jgi:Glycosyltransferase family 17